MQKDGSEAVVRRNTTTVEQPKKKKPSMSEAGCCKTTVEQITTNVIESSPIFDGYENPTTQEQYDQIFLEDESSEENECLDSTNLCDTSNLKQSSSLSVEISHSKAIVLSTKSISTIEKLNEHCTWLELYKFEKMTSMLVDSRKKNNYHKKDCSKQFQILEIKTKYYH